MSLELHYWGIKGRMELIRHILVHNGVEYTDCAVASPQALGELYAKCDCMFPNIPMVHMKDGSWMSQTNALVMWACMQGEKNCLTTDEDSFKAQEFAGHVGDCQTAIMGVTGVKGDAEKLKAQLEVCEKRCMLLEKMYEGKQYFFESTSKFTWCDVMMFCIMGMYRGVYNNLTGKEWNELYPNMAKARAAYREEKGIKEYLKSQENLNRPYMPPHMMAYEANGNNDY